MSRGVLPEARRSKLEGTTMRRRHQMSRTARGTRPFIVVLVLALAVAAFLPAAALAATWTNGTGGVWSIGSNWSGYEPPVQDEALTFPAGVLGQATNDLDLTVFGAISVSGYTAVGGSALGTTGPLSLSGSPAWDADTYAAADLTVNAATDASATVGGSFFLNDVEVNSVYYGSHSLIFNVGSRGSIRHAGSIIGPDQSCSVTKTGAGTLRLGWAGADDEPWSGLNNWAGSTSVQNGQLTLWNPGALSSAATSNLAISCGARVRAHYDVDGYTADAWDGEITGSGDIDLDAGELTLRGNSMYFNGTTTVSPGAELTVADYGFAFISGIVSLDGGTLRGQGGVGTVEVNDGGVVSPGSESTTGWPRSTRTTAPTSPRAAPTWWTWQTPTRRTGSPDSMGLHAGDRRRRLRHRDPADPFTIRLRSSDYGSDGLHRQLQPLRDVPLAHRLDAERGRHRVRHQRLRGRHDRVPATTSTATSPSSRPLTASPSGSSTRRRPCTPSPRAPAPTAPSRRARCRRCPGAAAATSPSRRTPGTTSRTCS